MNSWPLTIRRPCKLGYFLFHLIFAWMRIQRIVQKITNASLKNYTRNRKMGQKNKRNLLVVASFSLVMITMCSILLFDENSVRLLTMEDGLVENIGAFSFFIAAVLFFTTYTRSLGSGNNIGGFCTKKNIFYLLLGILFLIACGEEISWGQRIFNWQTPGIFSNLNMQGETNIHNLNIFHGHADNSFNTKKTGIANLFTMSRLFSIFWLLFCFFIPILNKYSVKFNRLFKHIGLPIAPIWIGCLFFANFIAYKIIFYYCSMMSATTHLISITEIKETNYAFSFAVLAYCEFKKFSGLPDRN